MKKLTAVLMVIVMTAMMGLVAHGEGTSADLIETFGSMKVFQTEGTLSGTWTIGFTRDENNRYPCALDLGDGRIIMVPLTDSEVNALMVKALEEAKVKAEEANKEKEPSNPSFIAKVGDWITFWN